MTPEQMEKYCVEGYEFTVMLLGKTRTINISPADAEVMEEIETVINLGMHVLNRERARNQSDQ